MIRKLRANNYKSLASLDVDLGRVTVLIGANGSGKSNILEAIALASAASQNKLDNEFLVARGIRVTETRFMQSAFSDPPDSVHVGVEGDNNVRFHSELNTDATASFPKWKQPRVFLNDPMVIYASPVSVDDKELAELIQRAQAGGSFEPILDLIQQKRTSAIGTLPEFLVYAPENTALRTFQSEGQILPLGIKGEGLFAHLVGLNSEKNRDRLAKIKEKLTLIDWFENFDIPENLHPGERSIRIRDHFLQDGLLFDQRSANEGFLFLLFYMTLFISPETPAFFSIENIDTCLNPKLCVALLREIVGLAKEFDKQVILTTHNPAILDGLDLRDDEQRLLVVDRNKQGFTRVHRVDPPNVEAGEAPVSLSEAFMRGYIGGLPKNF